MSAETSRKKLIEVALPRSNKALTALADPDPWGPDIKASEAFLDPLFKRFYDKLKLDLTRLDRDLQAIQ